MDTGRDGALLALSLASVLHAGFQVAVTVLVYPALARQDDEHWAAAHDAHSRAIVPLVGVVYGLLVLAGGWALATAGSDPWVLLATAAGGVSLLGTALVAAPTHAQLGRGRRDDLVHRLMVVDRVRAGGAVVCALAALVAVAS